MAKEFSKLLVDFTEKPSTSIIEAIDKKEFPFKNDLYNYKPEYLAIEEYKNCLSTFERRNPGTKPSDAMFDFAEVQDLISKEENLVKPQLEQLAINVVRELYNVPDYIDMKAIIDNSITLDSSEADDSQENNNDLTAEEKEQILLEIKKREILNSIVHGSSVHIWKGIFHLVSNELDRLNPKLKELYNVYTSSISIGLWQIPIDLFQESIRHNDSHKFVQGFVKISFEKTNKKIGTLKAEAINFCVLLHELSKGVFDYLISAGIPKNYNNAQIKYYYAQADKYSYEPFYYLLAPTLWNDLLVIAKIDNEQIPDLVSGIAKLSYQEILDLFRLVIDNKERAYIRLGTLDLI